MGKEMGKRIGLFTITLSHGGAERAVSNLSLNLKEVEKYIFLIDGSQVVYPYNGSLIDLRIIKSKNKLAFYFNLLLSWIPLFYYKRKLKLDVVISFLDIPNLMNIITGGKRYISVRTHVSGSYNHFKGRVYKWIIKTFFRYADKVIAVSKDCGIDLVENFNIPKKKVISIPNFYDLEKIRKFGEEELEDEYKEIFKKKVIINSGRLSNQKSQKHLIEALAKMKNSFDYNLVILGDGPLKKELLNLAKEMGVRDRVYLLGFQKNPFKFLRKSYLYVFPSIYEGFPNALAEAMACNLPVISNDCPSGPSELLDNGTYGILLDMNRSEEEYMETLIRKMELFNSRDTTEYYREKSKERIREYSQSNIIRRWTNIL